MGTRITGIVTCRKEEQQLFKDAGFDDEEYDDMGKYVRLMGSVSPDPEQFKLLPPCLAWLSAHPNDMDPLLVAWDGTELCYVQADSDEFPVVRVGPDGTIEAAGLEDVRKYQTLERKVQQMLGVEEQDG